MSSYLWKAYYDNNVLAFQQYLLAGAASARPHTAKGGQGGPIVGSPSYIGSSPNVSSKIRKAGATGHTSGLSRPDINARDHTGQTLLHHVASSTADTAVTFATALIEHPLIDLYIQDWENGWTALHRAFYFGNITIARIILERDAGDALGRTTGHVSQTVGLIKIKDREGHGPLDLYAATIKDRTLRPLGRARSGSDQSDEDRPGPDTGDNTKVLISYTNIGCDQMFNFGSNRNASLGFGDGDDRQFPERIQIRRPAHLIRRFYEEHLHEYDRKWKSHDPAHPSAQSVDSELWVEDIPWMPRTRPLVIQDVLMSKLHSAILTTDPESNLYMCGHGKGGRLGAGDEQTRFNFVCVESGVLSGKHVATVALGLNHTLALSDAGEIFSWGNNGFGQLGYGLPRAAADEDPIGTIPRQIFGPLKREIVIGIAASRIHSVAHTGTSLFTFGKNEGQLGIIDSDARSLETQTTPRKVAASLFASTIAVVSAMDKATVCLLESHEVWVFANYGYAKLSFPLEGFTNYFLKQSFLITNYDSEANKIVKVTCGGDTICALSSRGEIYTLSISQRQEKEGSSSTTNPAKIRSAITSPQRIWSPKKHSMAARDVGVEADGSIILSTEEGSVWKRTKRTTLKDATSSVAIEYKPKDYKFSRMPGLTRVLAVRTSAHGAYAAIRKDCDVTKTQIVVEDPALNKNVFKLLALSQPAGGLRLDDKTDDETRHRFWQRTQSPGLVQQLRQAVLVSKDIEADLAEVASRCAADTSLNYDCILKTTASNVAIPIHRFMLTGRSRVMRRGFRDLCPTSTFTIPDLLQSEIDNDGRTLITFSNVDILTMVNVVIYLYTDNVVDFWHHTRYAKEMTNKYRYTRNELMKVATKLELMKLETAARQMVQPIPCLNMDFDVAYADPAFFYDGDVVVQLEDEDIRVHSALMRVRCPFFEGLFMGRAGGRWLVGRDDEEETTVDLTHISSKTFSLVLRYIYADTGAELFDDIVSVSLDDFLDSVMDVLSVANELMLDRLSQICQEVIGRFVNTRNVCGLLNAISPSSVHEFKDAALEYLCLSLEAMLQGHHLNELDEDLLEELDNVVRENQLACMPFAKSGRAELLLHERHPELAATIQRNRQTRVDAVSLRTKYSGLDTLAPGFAGDEYTSPPPPLKSRRRSSNMLHAASPKLRAKASTKDMMFEMDEESDAALRSPEQSPSIRPMSKVRNAEMIASSSQEETWFDSKGRVLSSPVLGPQSSTPGPSTPRSPLMSARTPSSAGQPWTSTPLSAPKSDMRDIMAQTASRRTSILTQGLAASRSPASEPPSSFSLPGPKLSQKDRKRLQHNQQSAPEVPQVETRPEPSTTKSTPAWQPVSVHKPAKVRNILSSPSPSNESKPPAPRTVSTPQLTMRQTVANSNAKSPAQTPKQTTGPSGQGTVQSRSVSDSKQPMSNSPESTRAPQPLQQSNSRPIPQSIRHQPPVEQILGLSISEIIAQEQFEKDVIKEAVAPRDLGDIQAEQEFEEWWSRESARVQEVEKKTAAGPAKGPKKHRPRAGKSAKGAKDKGKGEASNAS